MPETSSKPKNRRGPADAITVLVALIVVAVLAANILKQQPAQAPAPEDISSSNTTPTDTTREPSEETTTTDSPTSNVQTNLMGGSEFEQKTRAESIINSTQGKTLGSMNYEYIVSGVVTDANNTDLVYFATHSNNSQGNFVGVYQYNTKTFQWQRYYKNAYLPEGDLGPKELRVIGQDGRNLILLVDQLSRDEDTCDSYWLIGTKEPYALVTLNLDTPLDGFKPYTLPDSLRESEETRVATCQAS